MFLMEKVDVMTINASRAGLNEALVSGGIRFSIFSTNIDFSKRG